jgi:signal transduction histidine kinase/CheY-like chemotaxis protein
MSMTHIIRVRIAAPPAEARKLCARLNRGGIAAEIDDGSSRAEILVVKEPKEVAPFRARATQLLIIGSPGAKFFAAGADDVVTPEEPEILFRRLRAMLERVDLLARLERLNERVVALEDGLADAAHDVRSPLQAVIGNAELLARDESLTEGQRACAAAATRQSLRALHLAERILEGARTRQRIAVEAHPVDLGQLVSTVAEQAQAQAKARGVTLTASPPPTAVDMRADGDLLSRLLDNLVANALRATPRGGHVEVSAWRASPTQVRLSVRDDGQGIAAQELPKLVAGLGPGRGLRIARSVAERHGGDFWAESSPGNGTRFFIELPLSPPSSRPRVLIVSDDQKWLKEMSRTLRSVCEVRSATLAAAKLGNRRTDLVLVDPTRPSGKKLEALRSEAQGAQVPVIELPSDMAASRLARTLAQIAP